MAPDPHPALAPFSPAVRAWFSTNFAGPTPVQARGWPAIASGAHALLLAPTGSGKTLAAFLWGIDRLATQAPTDARGDGTAHTRLVYVSPLRALAVDVEKNLRAPLVGIAHAAARLGQPVNLPSVGLRTGDTSPSERRRLVRHPPDILITTPESLYLMLTSAARDTLAGVETVIVDEIHAVAATKRGSHLALTLERLAARHEEAGTQAFQRIGLSATQRPLDEIARFLGGFDLATDTPEAAPVPRPVTIIDAGVRKTLDVEVVVPVDDMGALGESVESHPTGPATGHETGPMQRSIWPAIHPRLLELIEAHRSTIVFTNARRLTERLAARMNELATENASGTADRTADGTAEGTVNGTADPPSLDLVKAHHGSLSRERRLAIEDDLKAGRLRGLVATSSLELGIDMGTVDLVVLVESPGSVARGLQRVGRAGHQVGEASRAKIFPKHRADLLEAAVVVSRMHAGLVEETHYPRNPLDVLAQQIVAMVALDEWTVEHLATVVRRAAPFSDLGDDVFAAVLDMLAGRYPSEAFAELRPRVVWDRVTGVVRGRAGSQRLAVTSGGTIPDRGLFGVFLPDGTRVGELDEEMVYESRVGESFRLGASTWRIEDITFERVVVTPAPGQPAKMPFWHGDRPGRPLELGRALGAFVREVRALPPDEARARLTDLHGCDERAATNLLAFLDEQAEATGVVPDDRTIIVEQFRDEIGDWRVCVLTPFGARVHAPWAMALRARLADEWGTDVDLLWSDDGIVVRLPEVVDELAPDALAIDPDQLWDLVVTHLPQSALFASVFRECAARSLLLPRRRPDRRTPLWQQRQRAADLLGVAAHHPDFPILLEATRECCHEHFDLPALRQVLTDISARRVRLVPVRTERASPMAQSLVFGWIAVAMYEGDTPLAERRAAALALDRDLLRELLGSEELRELLDPTVLDSVERELQCLSPGRRARDPDELHDLLRRLGPLDEASLIARTELTPAADLPGNAGPGDTTPGDGEPGDAVLHHLGRAKLARWLDQLREEHRVISHGDGAGRRWAAAEDAGRLRDALGVAVEVGLPSAYTEPVPAPVDDLVSRYARTHGPFLDHEVVEATGLGPEQVNSALARLEKSGELVHGEFRPDGSRREWCERDVLRQLRRRSLAALRREVEPVEVDVLGRFLPAWQGVGERRRGPDALAEALGVLAGAAVTASALEADVLAARVAGYRPGDLDELCAAGDLVWVGAGGLGARDGRLRLVFRDQLDLLVPDDHTEGSHLPGDGIHRVLREHLGLRGASFWPELVAASAEAGLGYGEGEVLAALWDLVWAGEVTNDTLAPLRAVLGGSGPGAAGRARTEHRGTGDRRGTGGRRGAGGRRTPGNRPRPGRLRASGPPAGAGRWSLVTSLRGAPPATTDVALARVTQLLERHGILTREAVLAEGVEGGFAALYPVLSVMEDRGQVRRGYFVAGLGAAQFALPGAVERLRSARTPEPDGPPVVLAATDPAQPYGAALAWPGSDGRPARAAGSWVVLGDGRPLLVVERGGRGLVTFHDTAGDPRGVEGLVALVKDGRIRSLTVSRVDGQPAASHPVATSLRAAGFQDGYRGLVLRS